MYDIDLFALPYLLITTYVISIVYTLDVIDTRILDRLVQNSSESIPKLAKRINVNTSVVYARIRRMQKRGLIERFTVDVNNAALGYSVKVRAGIKMDTLKRNHVIPKLFELDGVSEVSEVTGRFDVLVTIYAKSLDQVHVLVADKIGHIDGVLSTESFIEMKTWTKAMPYMTSEGIS